MGTEVIKTVADIRNWFSELAYEQWVKLPVPGPRPSARYKHAAGVFGEKLYVTGGSRNGRYLSDVQVLDLGNLSWSNLKLKVEPTSHESVESGLQEVLPAISGHTMVKWGKKFLLIGGHSKKASNAIIVRFIDPETNTCGVMEISGKVPVSRGGHSTTLVGSKLILFGGEDNNRRLLNDVHVLDLETMTWQAVESMQTAPAPRYDHIAAMHGDRYLLIFGGCSHSIFFNDLHLLDLQTMEWSQPDIQGDLVTPRAGHAGITIDDMWYIVGGGDNRNGCLETLALNMSKLAWTTLTTSKERHPLASEGLSVGSAVIGGERHLVAFGGYNGKYNNEVFILKLKPRDSSHPKIFQSAAAAAAAASVTAAYALANSENLDIPPAVESNFDRIENNLSEESITVDALKQEKKVLKLSLEDVRAENFKLREKIDEVNSSHAELSKELHSVRGQLTSESSRCFKLEAQIAELQKVLESLQSMENEVQILRNQKSALEQEMELNSSVQGQGSGGVWRWIAGGN